MPFHPFNRFRNVRQSSSFTNPATIPKHQKENVLNTRFSSLLRIREVIVCVGWNERAWQKLYNRAPFRLFGCIAQETNEKWKITLNRDRNANGIGRTNAQIANHSNHQNCSYVYTHTRTHKKNYTLACVHVEWKLKRQLMIVQGMGFWFQSDSTPNKLDLMTVISNLNDVCLPAWKTNIFRMIWNGEPRRLDFSLLFFIYKDCKGGAQSVIHRAYIGMQWVRHDGDGVGVEILPGSFYLKARQRR